MARPDIEAIKARREKARCGFASYSSQLSFETPEIAKMGRDIIDIDALVMMNYIAELEVLLREAHGYLPACTGIEEDIAALNLEQPATPASDVSKASNEDVPRDVDNETSKDTYLGFQEADSTDYRW